MNEESFFFFEVLTRKVEAFYRITTVTHLCPLQCILQAATTVIFLKQNLTVVNPS